METKKIIVWVKKPSEDEKSPKEIDAYVIGDLAVHKEQKDYESDYWVITSVKQGLKLPGETFGFKAAIECAKELNNVCKWSEYESGKNNDARDEAYRILNWWGLYGDGPV